MVSGAVRHLCQPQVHMHMCVQAKAGGGEEMVSTGLPANVHELYSANWEPHFCLILQGTHLCRREEQREEFGHRHAPIIPGQLAKPRLEATLRTTARFLQNTNYKENI